MSSDFEICEKCGAPIINGLCNCTIEKEKAEKEAQEEVQEKAQEEEEAPKAADLLKDIPGAPDDVTLNNWKMQYGACYVMPFSPEEAYVWRPLRRQEFQQIISNQAVVEREALLRETLVRKALLWPSLEDPAAMALTRAGLIDTLYQVIMQGSYFLSPELAMALVVEV